MQEKKQEVKIKMRVISPSANIVDEPQELIARAEEVLQKNNIHLEYSEHCNEKKYFLSGTSKDRAKDLMDAFLDKNVNAIISTQGGDNSNDLLDLLDYNLIGLNPKPFFGLSDITVLLNVISLKSGIKTYHGLDFLWGLGKNSTNYTENLLNNILRKTKEKILKNPNTPEWKRIISGNGDGILLGGCLPSFCLLLGTKYDPLNLVNGPYILILEDIGENKSTIKSKLVQISQHNQFNLCKGIILGSFAFCEQKPEENNIPIEELAREVFQDKQIPVARIEEIGHCVENIILPIGGKIKLVCSNEEVKFELLD